MKRFLGPFQGTSSYRLVPHLQEPIKPVLWVIIGCKRPRAGRLGTGGGWVGCRPTGAVTPAWLPRREGADTEAPIKLLQGRSFFTGILGGDMTSLGANWGLPQPFFLLQGLSLWLPMYILGNVVAFLWNAWTQWVLQPLAAPVLFEANQPTPVSYFQVLPGRLNGPP